MQSRHCFAKAWFLQTALCPGNYVLWATLVFFAEYDFHYESYSVALGVCCYWCG